MVMSGRGRLTLCAFAATVLAAGALLPLVQTNTWLVQAVFFVALVSGVGAGARRVPLARSLTVLLQAVAALLLLTVTFARSHAPLGLVPTPEVFQEFGRLLGAGGDDVGRYAIPAPPTAGIRLMLVGGVLVIGLVVDAIAVTFRSAAPAGLPLLALYSVAAGLSGGAGGTLWFLLAAAGYLLLLLAEGRDRLSQWGRVFGGGPRRTRDNRPVREREGAHALAPARTGRRIGAVALGIALVVPAALPSLDGGLLVSAGGGSGTGSGGGGTISAVNPLVSLQDNLNQPEDRQALRYKTNAKNTQDLYLRIMALDKFDGTAWKFSQRSVQDVPDTLPVPPGLDGEVSTTRITSNISAAPWYQQNYLPMPYPATKVKIDGRWRFEPTGRTLVGDRGQSTKGAQYTVSSLQVEPTREQLASAPQAPAGLRHEYTQVPGNLPAVVKQTALEVTSGAANDYEKAVKLQDWFATDGGFSYDTNVDSGTGVSAITRFLKDKRGFCVHFSFTMAAMARTLGIPARVAVGFTPGTPQGDGSVSVGLRDAHAWPELYFQGVGWTRFEPTPSRGSVPSYTRQSTPAGGPADTQQPESTDSAAPSAAPSASASCAPQAQRAGDCGAAAAQGAQPPADSGSSVWTVTVITLSVVGLLVLLLLLSLPLLWRVLARSRHLNAGGHTLPGRPVPAPTLRGEAGDPGRSQESPPTPAHVTARTLGAWREITDTAWDHGIPPDDSLTPRRAAERIARLGRLDGYPAEALDRVAGSVEQVLYARRPQLGKELAGDTREVRRALRSSVGRWTRLRALLVPRSSVRVIWALSERWSGFTQRWGVHRLGLDRWAGVLRWRPSRQRG
jgi:transglutaminase-like putative cysteine protease